MGCTRGDWVDGQNSWRRWMLAHNLPRVDGQLPAPFMPVSSSNQFHESAMAAHAYWHGDLGVLGGPTPPKRPAQHVMGDAGGLKAICTPRLPAGDPFPIIRRNVVKEERRPIIRQVESSRSMTAPNRDWRARRRGIHYQWRLHRV